MRKYCYYTDGKLEHCLNAIRNREITQREAEQSTRFLDEPSITGYKGNGDESVRKPGYQQKFTEREEAVFEKCVVGMCNFGFPLTTFDLRMVVHT